VTRLHDLTALEQAAAIRSGELSPLELTDHYLDRIERLNERVGAFVTVTADRARRQAGEAARRVQECAERRLLPPLHGVAVPVKDLSSVRGVRLTRGSAACADLVGSVDDAVVTRLRRAGTVLLGKTATPEFGLPCYTESAVAPPARTPWDPARSAGGSSGGAAAAVAAGLAPVAHGSDGGGSIRIPASACGLVGLKPTRGRISRGPLAPDLFGLVTDGPIARTVRDAAALLDVMHGPEPGDLYTAPPLPPGRRFLDYADIDPGRLRIARTLVPPMLETTVHPDCVTAYEKTSALLEELGHHVEELPPVFGPQLAPDFALLWSVTAALTPVDPAREHLLQPLTRWLRDRGNAVGGPELLAAHARLQNAVRAALPVLDRFDAILTPTLAAPPAPVGYFHDAEPAVNFERQNRFTPFCAVYNLSGQPAVTLPLHWNAAGLPIGVMLAGRLGGEGTLISLAAQLEAARPWRRRRPPIWDA